MNEYEEISKQTRKDDNIYNLYNRFHERTIGQIAKIIFKLTR